MFRPVVVIIRFYLRLKVILDNSRGGVFDEIFKGLEWNGFPLPSLFYRTRYKHVGEVAAPARRLAEIRSACTGHFEE